MKKLTLCYKYFDNPLMLAEQYDQWSRYPVALKRQTNIVLVDDCSRHHAAVDVPRPTGMPKLEIYRISTDRDWGQNGATNLGAFVAQTPWLLLTDMDHMVSTRLLADVLNNTPKLPVNMFARVDAPLMTPTLDRHGRPKSHPNSYLVEKNFYWKVGGHNEYFCGYYGTDRLLRNRFRQKSEIGMIDTPLIRYDRSIIADASSSLPRKENRNRHWLQKLEAKRLREMPADKILTLQFDWSKVL